MYEEIIVALNEAAKDKSVLTLVTGAGDYFCSGNDLSNFMSIQPDEFAAVAKESGELLRWVLFGSLFEQKIARSTLF